MPFGSSVGSVSFNLNCVILATYYIVQTAAKEAQAHSDEGHGVENEPIAGDGGEEDSHNDNNDKDDNNDNNDNDNEDD